MKQSETSKTLSQYQAAFKKAVSTRQWSMIREKIVPYVMPPLVTAALIPTSLALNIWEHIPPQGRAIAMFTLAAAVLASPFLGRKSGSVVVSKDEAIAAIDRDLGSSQPARKFNDTNNNDPDNPLWLADKMSIWERWGEKITDQKFKTGFETYYNKENTRRSVAHGLIACALASSLALNGTDSLRQGWDTAVDWAVPLPALEYTARITPPVNVERLSIVLNDEIQDAVTSQTPVVVHEQSILRIIAQNRAAQIYINGEVTTPVEISTEATDSRNPFVYEIELSTAITHVTIEDDTLFLRVNPDQTPQVTILGSHTTRGNQPSLRLEYTISDDTGAERAIGTFRLPSETGEPLSPLLEINRLPEIPTLPYDR